MRRGGRCLDGEGANLTARAVDPQAVVVRRHLAPDAYPCRLVERKANFLLGPHGRYRRRIDHLLVAAHAQAHAVVSGEVTHPEGRRMQRLAAAQPDLDVVAAAEPDAVAAR